MHVWVQLVLDAKVCGEGTDCWVDAVLTFATDQYLMVLMEFEEIYFLILCRADGLQQRSTRALVTTNARRGSRRCSGFTLAK